MRRARLVYGGLSAVALVLCLTPSVAATAPEAYRHADEPIGTVREIYDLSLIHI